MHTSPQAPHRTSGGIWRTLRFRLAVWNAGVVIVTALVTLLGLRQGVRWALVHEMDQVLVDDAREIALIIQSSARGEPERLQKELSPMAEGHEHGGWYVKLLDSDSHVVWSSSDARPNEPLIVVSQELTPVSRGGYRVVRNRLERPIDRIEYIIVGATMEGIEQDMARIDRWVLLAAGCVLLAAPLCGYWLAARAARTLGEIITTASRLRPSHLEERLPIRGSGDELDQLAHTVNSLLDRIAAYLDTKRDFLANAAHELRTPLAAIRSSVEVALNGERSPEEYEDLMIDVISECSALETLVNQLLLLSETEADLPVVKFETIDLRRLAAKAIDMFTGVADARGLTLRATALAETPIEGNAAHLRQVLNNLLDNAVKYTSPGGKIAIELALDEADEMARLTITDTGQGISANEQQHIFERFYRAESARSRGPGMGGTGLGLSICLSVVQSHGGEISCDSEPDRGTTFTVTLPLSPSWRKRITVASAV